MNERHLFRGKRVDNGEWVEGQQCTDGKRIWVVYDNDFYPSPVAGGMALLSDHYLGVDPTTICQCTGRSFSKRLAFVGDIFHVSDEQRDVIIRWDDYMLAFMAEDTRDHEDIWLNEYGDDDMFWIGNVHDNPELLGGEVPAP